MSDVVTSTEYKWAIGRFVLSLLVRPYVCWTDNVICSFVKWFNCCQLSFNPCSIIMYPKYVSNLHCWVLTPVFGLPLLMHYFNDSWNAWGLALPLCLIFEASLNLESASWAVEWGSVTIVLPWSRWEGLLAWGLEQSLNSTIVVLKLSSVGCSVQSGWIWWALWIVMYRYQILILVSAIFGGSIGYSASIQYHSRYYYICHLMVGCSHYSYWSSTYSPWPTCSKNS